MIKSHSKRLSKKLDLTNTKDNSSTVKVLQKTAKISDKRLSKNSPIHISIIKKKHKIDNKNLGK